MKGANRHTMIIWNLLLADFNQKTHTTAMLRNYDDEIPFLSHQQGMCSNSLYAVARITEFEELYVRLLDLAMKICKPCFRKCVCLFREQA